MREQGQARAAINQATRDSEKGDTLEPIIGTTRPG